MSIPSDGLNPWTSRTAAAQVVAEPRARALPPITGAEHGAIYGHRPGGVVM